MSSDESDNAYDPSDDDSSYADSDASSDSFGSLQKHLGKMANIIESICGETAELEARLETLQRPIENLAIEQFGDAPFHASSPFRKNTFVVKPPGFPGIDLTKRYSFESILATLRAYIDKIDAVDADGNITLNKQLQKLFGTQKTSVSYIELIGCLRNVLV